jgi:putative transposase
MPVHQAFRFELDPSTTTRSALGSHAGASRFAYNWGLALVKDRLDALKALEVLAMRQGARAGEARAWAAETAGPVPWTLYSCCVAGAVTTHAPVVQVSPSSGERW